MKIAVVVLKFPSVSETFILNHITGLIDAGHDVSIIAIQRNKVSHLHRTIKEYNLLDKTRFLPKRPQHIAARRIKAAILTMVYGLRRPRKVIKALRYLLCVNHDNFYERLFFLFAAASQSYDLFHFHFAHIARNGVFLKAAGIPITMVTSFHGHDVNRVSLIKQDRFYRELFEHGDHFVANTAFTKQQAVGLGCPESRITIIPVGLHVKDFPFQPRVLHAGETVQILTVGRLVEKKGHCYAVEAIARLLSEGLNVHYTIAGDGPLREELEALVIKLKIAVNVTFTGEVTQEEVVELYKKSHLFVLPSVTAADGDKEGQGLVLQEAQACGLPVISTLHNGIPDGVLDGQSGVLVPEKDVEALAGELKQLVSNPEIWAEMGEHGRHFVETNYDMGNLTKRTIEVYESLK